MSKDRRPTGSPGRRFLSRLLPGEATADPDDDGGPDLTGLRASRALGRAAHLGHAPWAMVVWPEARLQVNVHPLDTARLAFTISPGRGELSKVDGDGVTVSRVSGQAVTRAISMTDLPASVVEELGEVERGGECVRFVRHWQAVGAGSPRPVTEHLETYRASGLFLTFTTEI